MSKLVRPWDEFKTMLTHLDFEYRIRLSVQYLRRCRKELHIHIGRWTAELGLDKSTRRHWLCIVICISVTEKREVLELLTNNP